MKDVGSTFTNRLVATLFVVSVLIGYITGACGFLSGIWLVIAREWQMLILGFIFGIGGSVAVSLNFLFIGIATDGFLSDLLDSPRRGIVVIGHFVLSLWYTLFIGIWTTFIFLYFTHEAVPPMTIPLLLWGYAVAISPLRLGVDIFAPFWGLYCAIAIYGVLTLLFLRGISSIWIAVASGSLCIVMAILASLVMKIIDAIPTKIENTEET